MHAVLDLRGLHVRDPAAQQRRRKIGIAVADVGPRVAIHRALQHAAVDQHFHAGDAVEIGRPAIERERAADVVDARFVGDVDVAERRLIDGVVDGDGAPAEELNRSVAFVDAQLDGVIAVREAARAEAGEEPGVGGVDAGEGREGLGDVDARQIQHEIVLILIVDIKLDLADLGDVEHPPLHQNHSGLHDGRIRLFNDSDEVLCGERGREKRGQQGENKSAGNPSPHNPNLQHPSMPLVTLAEVRRRRRYSADPAKSNNRTAVGFFLASLYYRA